MGETYEKEKEVDWGTAEKLIPEVHAFISQFNQIPSFFMTMRKDGRPLMRPVSVFVEGWQMETITQDIHLKTKHVQRNSTVGYLWVDKVARPGAPDWIPKSVWINGTAEVIEDANEINRFFERRQNATGSHDLHPTDHGYRRILIRTTPTYLRAEGFAEAARPVVIRDFSKLAVPA